MSSSILVIDDELVWARNLVRYLQRQGFHAASVHCLSDAERLVEHDRPSLLCLDMRLPDGDGLALLERLRLQGDHTPCLLITGHANPDVYDQARKLDAAVIEKPAQLAKIRRRISDMLAEVENATKRLARRRGDGTADQATKMVVMYSHDGFGLGHMRRNLNLARALTADPRINVLMLVGCPNGLFFDLPPRIDFIKLPSIIKIDSGTWETRKLSLGMETTCALRAGLILHTLKAVRPDVFLVDFVPEGVGRELLPALDWIREQERSPRTVLGLRDILDQPDSVRATWASKGTYDVIDRYYDQVLVYGHQHVFDSAKAYGFDRRFKDRIRHCGYLAPLEIGADNKSHRWRDRRRKRLVATAGGGRDGFDLMTVTLQALRAIPDRRRPETILITGPLMEEDYRHQLAAAADGLPVEIIYWTEDSRTLIQDADVVLCMAGYNTLAETLGLGKRPIVVPRTGPSAEQRLRTELFADLGLVRPIYPEQLTSDHLADVLGQELKAPKALPSGVVSDLYDGLDRASRTIADLLRSERAPADTRSFGKAGPPT